VTGPPVTGPPLAALGFVSLENPFFCLTAEEGEGKGKGMIMVPFTAAIQGS